MSSKFQFPSNGKAYPKDKRNYEINGDHGFNSLQTGRHIQSCRSRLVSRPPERVSIPFKREGISKGDDGEQEGRGRFVSIPFKREGISKGLLILTFLNSTITRFNSLQTGRHIQRDEYATEKTRW